MATSNMGAIVADAWERALALGLYGTAPLTVGWWHGQAYVFRYDWRRGVMAWMPFTTTRQPTRPSRMMVEMRTSAYLFNVPR